MRDRDPETPSLQTGFYVHLFLPPALSGFWPVAYLFCVEWREISTKVSPPLVWDPVDCGFCTNNGFVERSCFLSDNNINSTLMFKIPFLIMNLK